jgi:tetratricopeptide (TPR) repeat protein
MYNRAQNHGVALIFANKCLEQNPNDIDVLRIKGVAEYFNGNYTQAIQTFNRVIVNNDQYGEVWFFLSMSEFMTGNFDKALQNIKHAIELEYQFDEGYLEILNDSIKTLANR